MVCSQPGSRSSTSREQRYSSGERSNASSSAVVPRSRPASSYSARACPISFCAIDEKATSSSRNGAIPVHSESRQPRTSSSSAIPRSSSARPLTSLLQLFLERIPVHAVVVPVQLVDEILDRMQCLARGDPERGGLAAAPVLLARVPLGEPLVRSLDRPSVLERLALPFLPKDLVDHAARSTERTQAEFSRALRRRSSRSAVFGPWPVTTCMSSSQSGSVYCQRPLSSSLCSSGSGTVRPS